MSASEGRIDRAYAAFKDVLDAGMQAELTAANTPETNWRDGEYDVVVRGGGWAGILHEEIASALKIAEKHGGSLFLSAREGPGQLAILFPIERAPGPDDPSPGEVAAADARRGKRPRRRA